MVTVSCAIPCFNEGNRLPPFLSQLAEAAATVSSPAVEFVITDDGSRPDDREKEKAAVEQSQAAMTHAGAPHTFRFVEAEQNRGKGAAIRLGWENADPNAQWLGFVDADGAISPSEFFRVLSVLVQKAEDADVVAGSRVKMAGRHIERNLYRHLQGRVFATLVEQAFGLGFYDTQCGLKFFRASLLRPQLGRLREDHWMLDVELLGRMKALGARFEEVPIDWIDAGESKVRFGVDAVRMFFAIQRIKRTLEQDTGA